MKQKRKHLSAEQRAQVLEHLNAGMPADHAAFFHDVSIGTIYNIKGKREPQEKAAAKKYVSGGLTFAFKARPNPAFEFVLGAAPGMHEGLFPLGDPSLIGGASGAGKSTLMIDMLETQYQGKDFLDHKTFRHPYLIVMADRGSNAHARTAARTGVSGAPTAFIPMVRGKAAIQKILEAIEAHRPLPSVVFVEGCDLLVEGAGKMDAVMSFMEGLQAIASYYHIALIGSVGSAKSKPGRGYIAQRDKVFGSIAWSRTSETVALIEYAEGDDMDKRRVLSILPRNSSPEKYHLVTGANGRLVLDDSQEDEPRENGVAWFREQKDRWFTAVDYENETGASPATAYRHVNNAVSRKILKPGRKIHGKHRVFQWNSGQNNPMRENES